MPFLYILDENHNVIPCEDIRVWMEWVEKDFESLMRVAKDTIDNYWISTVFLPVQVTFPNEKPHLFETIVFQGEEIKLSRRCATWDEAIIQHNEVLEKVREWKTNTSISTNE